MRAGVGTVCPRWRPLLLLECLADFLPPDFVAFGFPATAELFTDDFATATDFDVAEFLAVEFFVGICAVAFAPGEDFVLAELFAL